MTGTAHYNAAFEFIDANISAGRSSKTALIDDQGSYSYAELTERVNQAGNALLDLASSDQARVLMCLQDSVDFPAVFWGGIKAGLLVIPLNTLMTTADYDYILQDSGADILVVSEDLFSKFEPVIGNAAELKQVVIAGGGQSGHRTLGDLTAAASDQLHAKDTSADDIAFWLYTSGSTGKPKGVMHRHSDLIYTAKHYGRDVLGIREDDIVFSAAKMFFAYGLGNSLTFPLYAGATAVVHAGRPTPDSVMTVLQEHQPTLFFGVPTLYAGMLANESNGRSSASQQLRLAVSAGEALPEDIGSRWQTRFGAEIIDGLGSTEMLHIFLSNRPDDVHYGTTGVPVPGYDVHLLDESDNQVDAGEIGELVVRGGSAATAYWNQPDKSAMTFRGEWTHTGDQYICSEDGLYTYCGRNDDMLKVGGIWVSPFEVESVLIEHESVLEVGVVGFADEHGLIKPKAFIVLQDNYANNDHLVATLQQFVKDKLAPYKYPRWIEFVAELPKTATGKVQRFKLRD
jgi:4-hydroxybenzoate-CoA ligase